MLIFSRRCPLPSMYCKTLMLADAISFCSALGAFLQIVCIYSRQPAFFPCPLLLSSVHSNEPKMVMHCTLALQLEGSSQVFLSLP